MVTKVQKMLNSNRTADPFETSELRRSGRLSNSCANKNTELQNKILVTVTESVTNVPQTNNTSTSGMNEE
jgi:hypothetical protein